MFYLLLIHLAVYLRRREIYAVVDGRSQQVSVAWCVMDVG